MSQRDIQVGHRLVSVKRLSHGMSGLLGLEGPLVERVTWIDEEARRLGHNMRMTLSSQEGDREVVMAHTGFCRDGRREILWSDPLPEADDDAIALVGAAYMRADSQRSLLFWTTAASDGVSYCHLVTDTTYAEEPMVIGEGMHHSPHGIAMRLPGDVQAGSLIAVDRLDAAIVEGRCVHTPRNVMTVMRGRTLAEVVAIPRVRQLRRDFGCGSFGSMHDVNDAEEWAMAREEPSEALAVVWMDGDDQRTHVLGSSGVAFHRQDDIACYLEGKMPGVGLWLFANASMHGSTSYEGEYDQDLDGDALPADHAAIERLFGPIGDFAREMVDVMDEPVEADALIAQAVASEEADRIATEAFRLERERLAERRLAERRTAPAT